MKKLKQAQSVNELFPNALARMDADRAIDSLSVDEPMRVYLDTWEAAYFKTAGESPFRPKRSKI